MQIGGHRRIAQLPQHCCDLAAVISSVVHDMKYKLPQRQRLRLAGKVLVIELLFEIIDGGYPLPPTVRHPSPIPRQRIECPCLFGITQRESGRSLDTRQPDSIRLVHVQQGS